MAIPSSSAASTITYIPVYILKEKLAPNVHLTDVHNEYMVDDAVLDFALYTSCSLA